MEELVYRLLDVQRTKIDVERIQDHHQRMDQRRLYYSVNQISSLIEN
jgi:hypothetical protein